MTKSLSNTMRVKDYPKEKPNTRVYSIIPARAVQDDSLHPTSLKVLVASAFACEIVITLAMAPKATKQVAAARNLILPCIL